MPRLVLGPLLRYIGEHEATVWVETDRPAEVILEAGEHQARTRTFHVEGHHYALVVLRGLPSGAVLPYTLRLDGDVAWPIRQGDALADALPPPVIRTLDPDRPPRLSFGSCRAAVPQDEPWSLPPDGHPLGRGTDALRALATHLVDQPLDRWPDSIFLIGDQVYADEPSPGMLAFIRSRRDVSEPPGEEIADFQEYAELYRQTWSEPSVRWVLSTLPSAMIFDDHDVRDDWNISEAWVRDMRAQGWWDERIVGALMSYWLYQHLGNLAPDELEGTDPYEEVRAADDGGAILRDFAFRADRDPMSARWSYCRDYGRARVIVMDSRATRLLDAGRRDMIDEPEWAWIDERAGGDLAHLVLVSSVPFLLAPGLHDLEAWSEAVRVGRWGRTGARLGELVRREIDLEHWGAFAGSFARFADLLRSVAAGERGRPPISVTVVSGDVHYAYLARVGFPRLPGAARPVSRVHQVVLSPLRNPLPRPMRLAHRFGVSLAGRLLFGLFARLVGAARPPISWRVEGGPWFRNHIGSLMLRRDVALFRVDVASTGHDGRPRLDLLEERLLSAPRRRERRWRRARVRGGG